MLTHQLLLVSSMHTPHKTDNIQIKLINTKVSHAVMAAIKAEDNALKF